MSRTQQDQFIDDDEEEACPLCVEEFDLTDKGFRPCPCGYQICQFCYHHVKVNLNGLCPACRRPYNDKDIEYKVITPEETAAHKARQAQRQKKTQAALQKEKQKAEADHLSRKHLAGLRVVQKNLVYVTGLSPTSQEDQLLATLRGDQYFGQYGKIIKIVVSKAKDPSHPHSVGVYVTYEHKEDAANCIMAVNGSKNGDRTLRAQFGTTKYCSAYLRNETCQNRSCMFLHEPGEANESYSRADLSALNAGSSQGDGRPPPQSQQPVASAAQPMVRQPSSDQSASPQPSRPALPSTASWASRPIQAQASRTESRSTSGAMESPTARNATPASASAPPASSTPAPAPSISDQPPSSTEDQQAPPSVEPLDQAPPRVNRTVKPKVVSPLANLIKDFTIDDFKFVFSVSSLPPGDMEIVQNYPPLFDHNGGAKRRLRRQREEEQRRMEQEVQAFQQPPSVDPDDNPEMSGSLQLGGEPEERTDLGSGSSAIRPPGQEGTLDQRFRFGGIASPSIGDHGLTPQERQQLLLQTMKSNEGQSGLLSNLNQSTTFPQGASNNPPGHQRNVSRFSFANDTSASTTVKPVANPKLMNQQSAMMPQAGGFGGQQHTASNQQFFTSNVQGPPPGLKTTGTPPVSGGMTFGQGHGFATGGLQYGANSGGRNANEEMMRNLLRGRETAAGVESAKQQRDTDFPPLGPPSRQASLNLDDGAASRRSTPPVPPGFELQHANESRRSTPTVPPGLTRPSALPAYLDEDGPISRPSSRASLRRQASMQQIVPVLPLRPGTPSAARPATPSRQGSEIKVERTIEETPTKAPKRVKAEEEKQKSSDLLEKTVNEPKVMKAEIKQSEPAVAVPVTQPQPTEPAKEEKPVVAPTATKAPESPKARRVSGPLAMQPASKGQPTVQASDAKAAPVTPSKPESTKREEAPKRKHPGKLDITAAVKKQDELPAVTTASTSASIDEGTPNKVAQRSVSQTPSIASKPESPIVSSPAVKTAPRTLRLTQTPKTETPPPQPSISTPVLPTPAAFARLPSRQPSVASINLPGTPSSEQISISDNISLASTSQSRANTPPPVGGSKVGSAPLRNKTKSQLKKERQERAKAIEESKIEEVAPADTEETAQEAIISRKKKAKREKEPKAKTKAVAATGTADTTPTASRPVSPSPKTAKEEPTKVAEQPVAAPAALVPVETRPSTPTKASAFAPPMQTTQEPSPPPTPTLTAAALLAELKSSAPEIQKCIDSLFRTPTAAQFKTDQKISPKDLQNPASWKPDFKINLTRDEVDALLKGTMSALNYGGTEGRIWDRGMITPSGAHLRALTEELESRFLELERALHEMPDELRFKYSKPQNETKFPTVDLEALKRGFDGGVGGRQVSAMEQMVQDGNTMKKGAFLVDEASKYINEFVMPPVTPPLSASGRSDGGGEQQQLQQQGKAGMGAMGGMDMGFGMGIAPSVEIAERSWAEARRVAEEKENALRKVIRKNKKLLGL